MSDIVIRIDADYLAKAIARPEPIADIDPVGAALDIMAKSTARRYTLALAYPADRPDVGKAKDGFRDFMKGEAVEDMAWRFLANNPAIGLWHGKGSGVEGHGDVVESYIYRGPDWNLVAADGSSQMIKAGDWLLGTIWDEQTFPLIEAKLINGMSPQGRVRRDLNPGRV